MGIKEFFLFLFSQPTSMWLETVLGNVGLKRDFQEGEVLKVLKRANFSDRDLDMLITDLKHSYSHTKFNSKTHNGTIYDSAVRRRYKDLWLLVLAYQKKK